MGLVDSQVIANSRLLWVKSCSSKFFVSDYLPRGCLHKRRSTQEYSSFFVDHYDFVTHWGDVGSSCSATTQDDGNLRDSLSTHSCLVEEDPSKVVFVGEDLILLWQKSTCWVHHVDARQVVFLGYLLSPNVLFDSNWVICTTLKCKVIGDNHTLTARDCTYTSNNISTWDAFWFIEIIISCKLTYLKERAARVQNSINALSGHKLVSLGWDVSLTLAYVQGFGSDQIKLMINLHHLLIILEIVLAQGVHLWTNYFHVGFGELAELLVVVTLAGGCLLLESSSSCIHSPCSIGE